MYISTIPKISTTTQQIPIISPSTLGCSLSKSCTLAALASASTSAYSTCNVHVIYSTRYTACHAKPSSMRSVEYSLVAFVSHHPLQLFCTTAFLFIAATVTARVPLPAGTTSSKRTKKYSTTKQATLRSACCSSLSQAGGTCFDTLCPRCVCSWCKYLLASKRLFQCRRTTENRLYTAFAYSIASVSCDCICSCVC